MGRQPVQLAECVKRHYRGLVIRAAEWICSYIDEDTGLPRPSWDLWEERYGVHSWTVAAVWAGLQAAAKFAEAFGKNQLSLRYQRVAAAMQAGVKKHMYSTQEKRFVRSLLMDDQDSVTQDPVMDSSLVRLWFFGMFAADDPLIVQTMETMRDRLQVQTAVGGMARYENDSYHQINEDTGKVPGNPWFICTLWLAQWFIATATSEKNLQAALECIEWVADHTLESGVMAEQVHPYTNEPLSVSPLTWSHATYVDTLLKYHKKDMELAGDDH